MLLFCNTVLCTCRLESVACCEAFADVLWFFISFWKIQLEFIYFEIYWGFSLLFHRVLFSASPEGRLTHPRHLFKLQFCHPECFFFLSECETVKAVHFTRDMLSICQVICKRLGSVSTLFPQLLPDTVSIPSWNWHYFCPGPVYQYLNPTLRLTINSLSGQISRPVPSRAVTLIVSSSIVLTNR